MSALLERVRRRAAREAMWTPGTRVIAAVSGGSDSVALACLLADLAAAGDLILAGLAHLHHGIRGAEADEDAAFCEDLATCLGVPMQMARADVPALARRQRVSLEVAGRHARRGAFADAMTALSAERVATAHTADDQAETVLLHLIRGAGLRGLGGIPPVSGPLIRPLLDATRAELRQYLDARQQSWREDASNLDLSQPRNRLRHDVIPALERRFNPSVRGALTRLAELARADQAYLDEVAAVAARRLIRRDGRAITVAAAGLAAEPPAIARRVALAALEAVLPGPTFGLGETELVLAAASGQVPAGDLRRVRMERIGPDVVLHSRDSLVPTRPGYCYELPVPGACPVPEAGVVVAAEGPFPPTAAPAAGPERAVVSADHLGAGVVVRSRLPGDRLRPIGMKGRKKVQDLFVDRKVPRDERDRVPLIVDRLGRLVWVAGHAVAEEFRVTEGTSAVVVLKLRRL